MNTKPAIQLMLAILLGVSVTACGRAGDPEPPPRAASTQPDGPAQDESVEDRPFILDSLLN